MIEKLETLYGTMFVPDTDNGQYWWLKSTGAYAEDEMIETVCELLDERPRGVVVDCGANFGCWSLPLARHARKVISFEPQRAIYEILRRTLAANPGLPIEARQLALGPRDGTILVPAVDVDKTTNFGGIALGEPHHEQPDAPMYEVPVVTLDDQIEPAAWADVAAGGWGVTFIKADVEGAELGLLQGATRIIKRYRPIMVVEADHPNTDTAAMGNFIQSLGYNVELFRDNNFIAMPV